MLRPGIPVSSASDLQAMLTLMPPSVFGTAGPLRPGSLSTPEQREAETDDAPELRNGLASPSISVASAHFPCLTRHCAARERQTTLMSTRRDKPSCCSAATSIMAA